MSRNIEVPPAFLGERREFAIINTDTAEFELNSQGGYIYTPNTTYSTGWLSPTEKTNLIKWAKAIWSPDATAKASENLAPKPAGGPKAVVNATIPTKGRAR